MGTWSFGASDASTVNLWSEKVNRDAEHKQVWGPAMYSASGDAAALRHPDSNKGADIIAVHTEFQGKSGNQVTLENVARITGRGVHNDTLATGTGANLGVYTMNLTFENVVMPVRSSGELNERRTLLNFKENAKKELGSWGSRKTEGGIVLALWGLTAPNNSGVLTRLNWNTTEDTTYLNTIQTFDSTHIVYAGDATSDATIDSADVMTAQLLTKLETVATEDLSIPIEPLTIDGEDCFVLFLSARGCEQLRYDQDWKDAQALNVRGATNPLLKKALGKYGMIYVIQYANCLNPAANVSRGILCGRNALQLAKVEDWSWGEDFEDIRKRRKVISVGGFFGVAATYFNSTRRNAIAVDHYVRT